MSRRVGREVIFKTLFEIDLNFELDFDIALQTAADEHKDFTENDKKFALKILQGVRENMSTIDESISAASSAWKINRMATVDRAILRLATYELKFSEDVNANIVINEAVELAKKYGADESSRFVNGVLSGILENSK